MAPLSLPLDDYNRPPKETSGFTSTSVDDGGEVRRPVGPPVSEDETVLSGTADQSTYLDAVPASFTPLESAGEVLVDLTTATHVYLSARVLEAHAGAELRRQYFRDSDSSWRYLDGTSGPAVPTTATGRIKGQTVAVESSATLQGKCWCRLGTFGGDAASPLRVGHVRMHRGLSPELVGDIWDFNPTEGAGTSITDKQGSGLVMTTNGAWQAGDWIKYDITGIFNFTHSVCHSDLFTLSPRSSMVLAFKAPAGFAVGTGGTLCGRKGTTGMGSFVDHQLRVDAAGKFNCSIKTEASGTPANADVTVTSTTVVAASTEYMVGMTHDGVNLKLWVNGVVEDTEAATGSRAPDIPSRIIVGGGETPFASEVPIDDMLIGRAIFASKALTADEMATLYAEFKAQYPGIP